MRRRLFPITGGLAITILLGGAACAHRSSRTAPPDPRLFAPSDPPEGRLGSPSPSTEHLKPITPAPKTAPEQPTLKPTPAPRSAPQSPPRASPPGADSLPKFGDYADVEELPEAIERAYPVYPEEARRAGVDGVVVLQALVTRDGTVADTRIVNSIPLLDGAAVACVMKWRFKPAMREGRPVAVWVRVPIRFTLH